MSTFDLCPWFRSASTANINNECIYYIKVSTRPTGLTPSWLFTLLHGFSHPRYVHTAVSHHKGRKYIFFSFFLGGGRWRWGWGREGSILAVVVVKTIHTVQPQISDSRRDYNKLVSVETGFILWDYWTHTVQFWYYWKVVCIWQNIRKGHKVRFQCSSVSLWQA